MTIKLREYLAAGERTYNYRIKTVVPMDDKMLDRIEYCLIKYQPTEIGEVHKTIFQRNPLDFPGVSNREVYFIDVSTSLPASSYILQQDIRMALGIPEKFIVVRAENEPTEVETEAMNAVADMEADAAKKGLKHASLMDNPDYPEAKDVDAEEFYGDAYNSKLTDYLAQIAAEREAIIVKTKNAPFSWLEATDNELDPKQDETDFNAGVKVKSAANAKSKKHSKSASGNLNDNSATYKRLYKDGDGKTEVLSKTGVAVSKKD